LIVQGKSGRVYAQGQQQQRAREPEKIVIGVLNATTFRPGRPSLAWPSLTRRSQAWAKAGAGNGIRTRDFDLGKVALYHW